MKKIRRQDRALETSIAVRLLVDGEYGVLSTVGRDAQPYGVPLNYLYKDDAIYFHCACDGHKIENLEHNPNVAFCVVGPTKVLPDEFSTAYASAMVFGVASEVRGDEWHEALVGLVEKYAPAFLENGRQQIAKKAGSTRVIKIEIDHISGKARR